MSLRLTLALALVASCGDGSQTPHLDSRVADSSRADTAATPDTPALPYRHSIMLDGADDFTGSETFTTTSASFAAYVTWDDQKLYIGYAGPDLSPSTTDAASKWLFIYLDTDPGAGTGAAQSELYNTQRATFPSGFGAEYYARYKADGTFTRLMQYDTGTQLWTAATPNPATAQTGQFLEIAIPLSAIGAGTKLGIVTWMINEKQLAEGSYAGLYTGNFTDGYAANLPLTAYLRADFTSPRAPADPANKQP